MDDKKTHELDTIINFIEDEKDLNEYITNTISTNINFNFINYLDKLIKEKNISKANIIKLAGIDRTYGYQIFNGRKNASRDKIIKICIAGKFTIEETNRLLSLGSYTRLYSKNPRDSIIMFSLNKGLSTIETDFLLDKYNQMPLNEES